MVVEVKAGDFDSSNVGQLGTYVVAVNHQIRTENDNPTVGLLVCRGLDRVEAHMLKNNQEKSTDAASIQADNASIEQNDASIYGKEALIEILKKKEVGGPCRSIVL